MGMLDGYGKCIETNGKEYEGDWKEFKPHGKGI